MKTITFFIGMYMLASFFSAGSNAAVREPAVAEMFYPADKTELTSLVTQHLRGVGETPKIDGQIIALIVPHAGLKYSGPIAAYAYKLLEQSPVDKVILCGPSHRYPFRGISLYGPGIQWRTPLGMVACNDHLCRQMLDKSTTIKVIPEAHEEEHCLEVQLPYLQTVLKEFTFVPVIMGNPDGKTIQALADALETLPADPSTIMIAATDWQHYMPASEGWKFDSLGIDCISRLDPNQLEKYLAEGKTQACGGGPMVAVMKAAMAKGANRVKILKYGDSGDITGDKSSVVSYVAAVLYKSGEPAKQSDASGAEQLPEPMTLTDTDKATLLKIARQTIKAYLTRSKAPTITVSENLKKPGAAFVTLTKHGQLRGCIGQTVAIQPLQKTVEYCAVQAAVADPRFDPVTANELDSLHIEISVLTPLQKVKSLDEIKVGRDGLMIGKGSYRGLLLPQVATDYGWDRTEFLEQTCRKAGLPKNAWQEGAKILSFEAEVFGE